MNPNKSKDVWIALGHCWHEWERVSWANDHKVPMDVRYQCIKCKTYTYYDTHTHPDLASREGTVLLLEEMTKREDFNNYMIFINNLAEEFGWISEQHIRIIYITQRGKLLDAVHNYMKEKGEIK